MKKSILPISIAALVVLQVISLARIGDLQDDLRDTKNQLASLSSSQSSQINNIYANIDTLLKRQSSIIDSYEFSFGKADVDKLAVPLTFSVTPKETKANTQATLYVSGENVVMSRNGTTFTATLWANIFDPIDAKVILAEGGIERTEKLGVMGNPQTEILPTVYARFERQSGTLYSKSPNELQGEYYSKGNVSIEAKPVVNNTIEKARLLIDVNGKIVAEEPVNTGGQWTPIDHKFTLSAGDALTMTVIATDSLGLNHRTVIEKMTLNENAEPVHGEEWRWIGEVTITDKDGKVLSPQ